ncbi:MAG TPA: maleylpyruvate isomerase family mycothiol-dependent enzyme [Egibacteraceae bacterium]|nr:maleylpyruvate isomerase family mycothiol-dependent enzyme [Egibacteraceae bacterium]
MHVDHHVAQAAFGASLTALMRVVDRLSDDDLQAASYCRGWTVGDVLTHLHLGLQEMLLGIVATTDADPDTDAAGYWRLAPPSNDDEAAQDDIAQIRFTRLLTSAYRRPTGLVGHMRPTVDGVTLAVSRMADGAVAFQRRVLTTGDFLATWTVEVAVHHLDLTRELDLPPPPAPGLTIARATIEALAGGALPVTWADTEAVLVGAGRVPPSVQQRRDAGTLVERLPVL